MRRRRRLGLALCLVVLVTAASAQHGADAAEGPFYLVPSSTKECRKVKNCVGVVGPWVELPAGRQATFLFSCPSRRDYVIGGTDARASSSRIRVWYDGSLGAPIGTPPVRAAARASLLFHAAASDGKQGWFQPILGCVSLMPKTKRSTVSVVPGARPARALDLRAVNAEIRLDEPLLKPATAVRCPRNESLVGQWSAFAVSSAQPPDRMLATALTIRLRAAGNTVHATFRENRTFGHLVPLAIAQFGAMCQPRR